MTSLAQYDRCRTAIIEAGAIDDILPLLDEFELAKLHAKQIKDQELLATATEFQLRAERRLGQIIEQAKIAGLFKQGKQKSTESEPFRPTLEEAGITKKLSSLAQKRSGIAEKAFELLVEQTRQRIAAGHAKIIPSGPGGARSIAPGRFEPDDSADYFPTPPWATRALCEIVFRWLGCVEYSAKQMLQTAWEPACGEGHIAEVLKEYFADVYASDLFDYGHGTAFIDFLKCKSAEPRDWIITNPPFGDLTEQFVLRALPLAKVGVAMFVRLQWLETIGRYENIFRDNPPTLIAFFCERVNLCKGRWEPDGSTATAYIWLVWIKGAKPQAPFWIPPGQRESLAREDDVERFTAHPVIKRKAARTGEVAA